jgi:hypothetical protein
MKMFLWHFLREEKKALKMLQNVQASGIIVWYEKVFGRTLRPKGESKSIRKVSFWSELIKITSLLVIDMGSSRFVAARQKTHCAPNFFLHAIYIHPKKLLNRHIFPKLMTGAWEPHLHFGHFTFRFCHISKPRIYNSDRPYTYIQVNKYAKLSRRVMFWITQ